MSLLDQKKIVIVSGWSNPGGSTIAQINMCNLFNNNNISCTFYGPHDWHIDKCNGKNYNNETISLGKNDSLIVHYFFEKLPIHNRVTIFSCRETNLVNLKTMDLSIFNRIHYVSSSQRKWHNIDYPYSIIPNVIDDLNEHSVSEYNRDTAGVIGSIDPHKQTHLSITRALDDGFEKIYIFGMITDPDYFKKFVVPLLSPDVIYAGIMEDKQMMYNSVSKVYHSSKRETYNLVKMECLVMGLEYDELDSCKTDAELWTKEEILTEWRGVLEL